MDPTDMPFIGVKIQPLDFSSTVSTNKMLYDIPGITDGSVDERTEVMGAGYVLGADPLPIVSFFARVGGPLASARAEAASLLQLPSCCGMCANGTAIKSTC